MMICYEVERAIRWTERVFERTADTVIEAGTIVARCVMEPLEQALLQLDVGLGTREIVDLGEQLAHIALGIFLLVPIINILVLQILKWCAPDLYLRERPRVRVEENPPVWRPLPFREEPFIPPVLAPLPEEMPFEGVPIPDATIALDDAFFAAGDVAAASAEEANARKQAFLNNHAEWRARGEQYRTGARLWQCSERAINLNILECLDRYRTTYPRERFRRFASVLPPDQRGLLEGSLHGGYNATALASISKLYDFINQRWTEYRGGPREEPFKRYIASVLLNLIDAHRGCEAQVNSQLETLLINVVVRWETSRAEGVTAEGKLQTRASYELLRYLLNLIKQACVVAADGNVHTERGVKRYIARALGIREASVTVGDYGQDNPQLGARIWHSVMENEQHRCYYNPSKHLIEQLRVPHGDMRVLRNEILLWARSHYGLEADDPLTEQFIRQISENPDGLGADEGGPLTYGAILYFLSELGLIEESPPQSPPQRGLVAPAPRR